MSKPFSWLWHAGRIPVNQSPIVTGTSFRFVTDCPGPPYHRGLYSYRLWSYKHMNAIQEFQGLPCNNRQLCVLRLLVYIHRKAIITILPLAGISELLASLRPIHTDEVAKLSANLDRSANSDAKGYSTVKGGRKSQLSSRHYWLSGAIFWLLCRKIDTKVSAPNCMSVCSPVF